MSGPWEQYQAPADGPWSQYAAPDPAPQPAAPVAPKAPSLLDRMGAAFVDPFKALGHDAHRYYDAATDSSHKPSALEMIPGMAPEQKALGSMAGDLLGVAGAIPNALIVQPGATLLDNLPAPTDPKTGQPMTKEQQHQANADMVAKALMALGPKGMKGGAVSEAITEAHAAKVAKVVTEVPREVVLDEKGALTPEGREVVAQSAGHDLHADDLRAGYDVAEQVKKRAAEPPVEPAPVEAAPVADATALAEEPTPAASDAPEAAAAPPEPAPAPTAPERVVQAQEFGVDLTAGQAERSFDKQVQEQALAAQDGSPEGQTVRAHFEKQAQQIKGAVERFQTALGDPALTKTDRGQVVQEAAVALRREGQAGVTALYKQARDLAEQASGMGDNAKALIRLDAEPLRAAIKDLMIDETVPESVRKGLAQWGAKFGLIGEQPVHVPETGNTFVHVRNDVGDLVRGPSFAGKVEPLDLTNAERFRVKLNDMFDPKASRNPQESLKPVLDDLVTQAAERAAREGVGPIGEAFGTARNAFKDQKATFEGGDVVQKIAKWKNESGKLDPEQVMDAAFRGGPEGLTNLRRIKAVFLSKGGERGQTAWRALQAEGLARIFREAVSADDTISGLKLNAAFKRMGPEKLKLLLGDDDFNSFMRLKRVIGDATIPLPKTTNPSGSGWAVVRFLSKVGMHVLKPAAKSLFFVRPLVEEAEAWQAAKQVRATVAGVTDYKPEGAAEPKSDPSAFVHRFLEVAPNVVSAALAASSARPPEDRR